ncbi:MAG: hypothetical protein AAFW98_15975 [Pseudomonadota bacterium]
MMPRITRPRLLALGAGALALATLSANGGDRQVTDHGQHSAHSLSTTHGDLSPRTIAQIERVRRGIARYRDIDVARREGWKAFGADEPLMGQHWSPPEEFGLDYQSSSPDLDFAQPNNLMYTEIDGEMVLTGAAFVVRLGPGEQLPEGFAGDADRWHVHDFEKAILAATEKRPILRWLAKGWLKDNWLADGPEGRARAAMVHVWATLPNPDGAFADHNRVIPLLKHGMDPGHAHHLSLDAARGLDLAAKDGCDNAYGGRLWIADASRRTRNRIMDSCKREAKQLAAALEGHRDHPAHLFGDAERAYRNVQTVFENELTPEQRARIAAMSEHGHSGDGGEHGGHSEHGGHAHSGH